MKKFKMRKGYFYISGYGDTKEKVYGYISKFFGLHRDKYGKYKITHIKTGYTIYRVGFKYHVARAIINAMENKHGLPCQWDCTHDRLLSNRQFVYDIILQYNHSMY